MSAPPNLNYLNSGPTISNLGMIYSVVAGYYFLGTEIDDKLSVTLALGKTVVVTGWNSYFSL